MAWQSAYEKTVFLSAPHYKERQGLAFLSLNIVLKYLKHQNLLLD